MASIEELLGLGARDELVIDEYLRTIAIPKGQDVIGVESDDSTRKLRFSMPRRVNGIDLDGFQVTINYVTDDGRSDRCYVSDAESSDSAIKFSWLVGREAVSKKGHVFFNVCVRKFDEDDASIVLAEFNTATATMYVLEGLEVEPQGIARYSDAVNSLITGWKNQVDAAIEDYGARYEEAESVRDSKFEDAELARDNEFADAKADWDESVADAVRQAGTAASGADSAASEANAKAAKADASASRADSAAASASGSASRADEAAASANAKASYAQDAANSASSATTKANSAATAANSAAAAANQAGENASSKAAYAEEAAGTANRATDRANTAASAAETAAPKAEQAASEATAAKNAANTAAGAANAAKASADAAAANANAKATAADTAANAANTAKGAADQAAKAANDAAQAASTAAAHAEEAASTLSGEIAELRETKHEVEAARTNYVGHEFLTIGSRMDAIEHTIHAITQDIELDAKAIHEIIQSGEATELFQIGDQLAIPWTDTAAGTQHVFMADVCHHFDGSDEDHPLVKLEDGSMVKGVGLQFHRTIPFGVVFSPKQAFYYTESGLAAGTYCFDVKVETAWGSTGEWATKGTRSYQFTAPQAIPAGGQLVFVSDLYSMRAAGTSVQCFAAFGTAALFAATLTEGSGGTKLGEITTSCHGGFNAYPRATYGNNSWRESCEREWLNSEAAKSEWNVQKTPWDRPHALATTKAGFLTGFSEDFRSLLANCSQMTQTHHGDPAGGAVVETFDMFFPLSARQHYFSNYLTATADGYNAEGVPWDYWRKLAEENGKTAPWAGWGTFPELITYDNTSVTTARYFWLRSAYRYVTHSGSVGCVHTSGYVSYANAGSGAFAAPACVIY